jgi:hypothetical protein
VDGERFDSQKEARRWQELRLLEKAGEIGNLGRQEKFRLLGFGGREIKIRSERYPNGRRVSYVADFVYNEGPHKTYVVEDTKGFDTPAARLKRAIFEAQYRIQVRIT